MISISILIILSAFGLTFFLLRRKKLWIRAVVGLALSALAIVLLLTLLILGGDPAPPGSIPYSPRNEGTAEQVVPSDGHKPSSHISPTKPSAPADAH
jgi:multisubunit Na+/H+ antiporter MnhC subunit